MLYSFVVQPKRKTIVNSTDLAVRCIHSENGDTHDVIVRMPDESGNVYIRSLGSLSESDVATAYGSDIRPAICKDDYDLYPWTDKLSLRHATVSKYSLCADHGKEVQATVIIAGYDHHVEINRKKLRAGEGGGGGFVVLRLLYGDIVCIDGNWLTFDTGVQKLKAPPSYPLKMVDYSGEFSKGKILGPNISLI